MLITICYIINEDVILNLVLFEPVKVAAFLALFMFQRNINIKKLMCQYIKQFFNSLLFADTILYILDY